jgi:pilus assembly protein Flp/PilA
MQEEAGKEAVKERGVRSKFNDVWTQMKKFKQEVSEMEKLIRFFKDEEGATAVEYALMVFLIAVAIIAIVTTLGGRLSATFQSIVTALGS